MARNPNPSLKNRHTLYIGKSGSGKSQALKQNPALNKVGRVMLWDESRDQEKPGTLYFDTKKAFIQAVDKAVKQKYFRIGWDGIRDKKTFSWWCRVAWVIADGKKPLHLVIEELSRVTSSGEAGRDYSLILNEGRKYGIIHHATTQRPQEITKTAYDNTTVYYIGQQKPANIERFSQEIEVNRADLSSLMPLEFYHYDENSGKPAKKIKLTYKK